MKTQTAKQHTEVSKTTNHSFTFQRRSMRAMLAFTAFVCLCAGSAIAQVKEMGSITSFTVQGHAQVDFVNAKAMPMPSSNSEADYVQGMLQNLMSSVDLGPSGGSSAAQGTGVQSPVFLGTPNKEEGGILPPDWGTNKHPFTTARADLYSINTNTSYPYRAAGKLFFNIGNSTYVCSASMIKRGIVVTAAHCVANYGKKQFYSNWQFTPAYRNGAAPYGVWGATTVYVLTKYYNGTDACYQYGVICPDDVAVIVLNGTPGNSTGWFGYWYGGGFTSNGLAEITQLGYPVGLDNGAYMERNDSQGYKNATYSNNTIIGSNMDGGSSGGPWIENFGLPSALTGETNGSFSQHNVVVGVTSWGYVSTAPKEQGAAPFTSGNINTLVTTACGAYPGKC